eukprot:3963862-Pleurochrysis_carterae.AAC.2
MSMLPQGTRLRKVPGQEASWPVMQARESDVSSFLHGRLDLVGGSWRVYAILVHRHTSRGPVLVESARHVLFRKVPELRCTVASTA